MTNPLGAILSLLAIGIAAPAIGLAGEQFAADTQIVDVSVNGGADTANPGTTCIKLAAPVAPGCSQAYIAIPNNNSRLIAAALTAKTTASSVSVYYFDSAPALHCPWLAFTTCSVISIMVK